MAEGQAAFEAQLVAAIAQAVALGTAAAHGSEVAKKAIQDGLAGPARDDVPQEYSAEEIRELAALARTTPKRIREMIRAGKPLPRIRVETTYVRG